ncbi:MAG: mannitol-1-phosphate 5-dehydrogenase, partial [Microbacterium sp.]|nr:mannitol-1-phosphate 5-dehydrogenase [Microbacterium sp.]
AALVAAVGAALEFVDPDDPQAVELQERLRTEDAVALTASVTGLDPEHPLFRDVLGAVIARQERLASA